MMTTVLLSYDDADLAKLVGGSDNTELIEALTICRADPALRMAPSHLNRFRDMTTVPFSLAEANHYAEVVLGGWVTFG